MKVIFSLFFLCFLHMGIFAQAPQAIKYQGIIRSNNGDLLGDSTFTIKISVRDSSAIGTIVYEETHVANTNAFGSFSLNVGLGTVLTGVFEEIEWGVGEKYLEQSVDFGNGFLTTGVLQFLSVPYALHAANGLPGGATPGQVLSVDSNGNFIWVSPDSLGNSGGGSDANTLIFTSDGF